MTIVDLIENEINKQIDDGKTDVEIRSWLIDLNNDIIRKPNDTLMDIYNCIEQQFNNLGDKE